MHCQLRRKMGAGRWAQILLAVLAFGAVGAVRAHSAEPAVYERQAVLQIHSADENKPGERIETGIICPGTQQNLLKSPLILNAALAMPGVGELPWIAAHKDQNSAAEWLAQKIEVRYVKGADDSGQHLVIAMKGDDPRQLAILVNAVARAYLDKVVVERRRQLEARKKVLERTYQAKAEEVQQRREKVRELEGRLGGGDAKAVQNRQQLLLDYILQLRKEITETRSVIFQKQHALEQFRRKHDIKEGNAGKPKGPIPDALLDEAAAEDPEYRAFVTSIAALEEKLALIAKIKKDPNDPSVRAIREAKVRAQQSADERTKAIREALQKDWNEGKIIHRTEAEHDALMQEVRSLKEKVEAMKDQFEKLNAEIEELGALGEELARRKQDLKATVATADKLHSAIEQIERELRGPDPVTLVREAPLPPN